MNPHAQASYPLLLVLHRNWLQQGQWRFPHWQVNGLLAGQAASSAGELSYRSMRSAEGEDFYIWSGLSLDLFRDSLQSYYQNLMGAQPSLFVLCHDGHPQAGIEPVSITADWSDAEAHLETDGIVLSVALAAPFTNWLAEFVLDNQETLNHQLKQNTKGNKGAGKHRHV